MEPRIIEINTIVGEGQLSIIDSKNNLPFDIKRIFYVYNIPRNTQRGGHAHKILKQFIWAINGRMKIKTFSQSGAEKSFLLDKPNIGLYIPEMIWSSQRTETENTIYCVAASAFYDESEYIREWKEFLIAKID